METTTQTEKPTQIHIDPAVLESNRRYSADMPAVLVIKGDHAIRTYEARVQNGPVTMHQGSGLRRSRAGATAWLETAPGNEVVYRLERDGGWFFLSETSDEDMTSLYDLTTGCK